MKSKNSNKVLYTATSDIHIRTFHLPILNHLQSEGFQVTLAVEKRSDYQFECVDDVVYLPFKRSPFKRDNLKAFKRLLKLINKRNFDYVHCHTPVVGVLTRLAVLFSKIRPKVIYTAHGFHFYSGGPKLNFAIFFPIEWLLSNFTDIIITINTEDFEIARKHLKAKEVIKIPGMGVDEEKFHPDLSIRSYIRKELGIEGNLVFVCVGELNHNKNQIFILQIFKRLNKRISNFKLLLIGTGDQKESLQKYATEAGLIDKVLFLGWQEDVVPFIQAADYGISASKREGFGIGLVEMLMVGLPVFASSNRGHKEVIDEGESGYLFKLGSPDDAEELIYQHVDEKDKFDRKKIIEETQWKYSIKKSVKLQTLAYKE